MNSKCQSKCLVEKELTKYRFYNENKMFPIIEKIVGSWKSDTMLHIDGLKKSSKGAIFKVIINDQYAKGFALYDGMKQFDVYIFGRDFNCFTKYYGQSTLHLVIYDKSDLSITNKIYFKDKSMIDFETEYKKLELQSKNEISIHNTYNLLFKKILQGKWDIVPQDEVTADAFDYSNDDLQSEDFFRESSLRTIFVSLASSVIFKTLTGQNKEINFQGANSNVSYHSINVPKITTFYKNIPYQTYPNTKHWHVITIDTNGDWVDKVKFFSFTPYLGTYEGIDYLANVNSSISSNLIKANSPEIFTSKRDTITIIYTFNRLFALKMNDPKNNKYVVYLPADYISYNFTIIARFENEKFTSFVDKIKAFTFDEYPYPLCNMTERLVNSSDLNKYLENYPSINSNYQQNKDNINEFIAKSKEFNNTYQHEKIYPYFYLKNNNHVVSHVYQLINSDSTANALINDFNKNYYQTGIIQLKNEHGDMKYSKIWILALNHTLSGYATSCNIQIYSVENQKSLKTFETSSILPVLSEIDKKEEINKGYYLIEIDTSENYLQNENEIAIFERVNYPNALLENEEYLNSGPRYSTFTYDENFDTTNSSETDQAFIVNKKNIYNIKTNDTKFSLHLNYNKYSTLNFRVFYQLK